MATAVTPEVKGKSKATRYLTILAPVVLAPIAGWLLGGGKQVTGLLHNSLRYL